MPAVVEAGFDELVNVGPSAAVDIWTAAWKTQDDLIKRAQLNNAFGQVWTSLGPAQAYEILATVPIGRHLIDVYGITIHASQPVYFCVGAYLAPDGWMVATVNFHTSRSEVLPAWITDGSS